MAAVRGRSRRHVRVAAPYVDIRKGADGSICAPERTSVSGCARPARDGKRIGLSSEGWLPSAAVADAAATGRGSSSRVALRGRVRSVVIRRARGPLILGSGVGSVHGGARIFRAPGMLGQWTLQSGVFLRRAPPVTRRGPAHWSSCWCPGPRLGGRGAAWPILILVLTIGAVVFGHDHRLRLSSWNEVLEDGVRTRSLAVGSTGRT
jgi:hypothetical protein